MYEVLIIWEDNTRTYEKAYSLEEAETIINNYRMAFGNQIQYTQYLYKINAE